MRLYHGNDIVGACAQIEESQDCFCAGALGSFGFKIPANGESLLGLHGYGVGLFHGALSPFHYWGFALALQSRTLTG